MTAEDPPDPLDSVRGELAALEAAGLRRQLREARGPVAAEMLIDGRTVVNFSSNNYLGLADHPALAAAAAAAVREEGTGAGAARLIGGNLAIHRHLEARLAAWKGTEAALLFGSGYQANLGILGALAGPDDAIFSDALNHASLIDGARLSRAAVHVYPHNDTAVLGRQLLAARACRRRIIATESVFSMDGDVAPLRALGDLARATGALLVVDDAHAGGVLGPGGIGLAASAGAHVQMGTLGKALGAGGAYAAGSAAVVDLLVSRARSFIFTTAAPVPSVAAAAAALAIVCSDEGQARRQAVAERATQLRTGLARLGLEAPDGPGHITPLIVGDSRRALELSAALLERDLCVQAIRPPTVPDGTARLRLTVMASHHPRHIERLLAELDRLRPLLRR